MSSIIVFSLSRTMVRHLPAVPIMSLRLYVAGPLRPGLEFALPDDAARHVQVRRGQPGDALHLFDGRGGEWQATILRMGKREVEIRVDAHDPVDRELPLDLAMAIGMPANERMDSLIEKATELGVSLIQPLQTERSVLRLDAERAAKRVAHWQAVAVGASEQSGRTRVPVIAPVLALTSWLAGLDDQVSLPAADRARRLVMSTGTAPSLVACVAAAEAAAAGSWLALSGPEGGLAPDEEAAAVARGFAPISLGPRILRADTAPLAWLAQMAALLASR
jgi:16S rRNA (uracil1498-N3)-methyltransferase